MSKNDNNQEKLRNKIPKIVAKYCEERKIKKLTKGQAYDIVFDKLGANYAPRQAAITQFIKFYGKQHFVINGDNLEYQGHFDEDESHRVV